MLQWTLVCMYLFKLVFLFALGKYPEVKLLDHMVVLVLIFWGTSILFSIVATWTYNPTNSAQGFPFLHTSYLTLLICCLFDDSLSLRCEVVLICIFPWWLVMLSVFSCICWPFVGHFFLKGERRVITFSGKIKIISLVIRLEIICYNYIAGGSVG